MDYNPMTECERISKWIPKPCPLYFPEKLKKYWNTLQYSHTPIESGWMIHYEELEKIRRHRNKNMNKQRY